MIILAIALLILGVIEMRRNPGSGVGLICLIIALIIVTAACGDDDPNVENDQAKTAINSCIARHGHPITTSDQYGQVYYIACDTNVVTVTP